MDFSLALIELSVVFGVAGWITYLQKGAQAGGGTGAAAEIKDDEEGATPTHWNLRAIDSCGLRWTAV